jgi:uncharacterized membrane protein
MVFLLYFVTFFSFTGCQSRPVYTEPASSGAEIVIGTEELKQGIPEFFTYRHRGVKISFFVIMIDGALHSFLDACESCYSEKKGYRLDGDRIVCRKCNTGYPVSEIDKGIGSCIPIRVRGRTEGKNYVIPVSMLNENAALF